MGSKIKLVEPTKAHMSKVERLEREEMQRELFEYAELNVTPPKHLVGEALKEWERIVPYIKKDVPVSEWCCTPKVRVKKLTFGVFFYVKI